MANAAILRLVEDEVRNHIDQLNQKNPGLRINKAFQIAFPKAFHPGNSYHLPIMSYSAGKDDLVQVASISFVTKRNSLDQIEVLPSDIDLCLLDPDDTISEEATMFCAGGQASRVETNDTASGLDTYLDAFNAFLDTVHEALSGIKMPVPGSVVFGDGYTIPTTFNYPMGGPSQAGKVNVRNVVNPLDPKGRGTPHNLDADQNQLIANMPEWLSLVRDMEIKKKLLEQAAVSYRKELNLGRVKTPEEFWSQTQDVLIAKGALAHACSYFDAAISLKAGGECARMNCTKRELTLPQRTCRYQCLRMVKQ